MANVTVTSVFTDIANAIRTKLGGVSTKFTPGEMPNAIENLDVFTYRNVKMGYEIENGNGLYEYFDTNYLNPGVLAIRTSNMDASTFNYPVIIGDMVTTIPSFLKGCNLFNRPVIIPNNVVNMISMFSNCHNLNSSITMPVTNNYCYLSYMFENCYVFNKEIVMPKFADMGKMFFNCTNFNSSVTFPDEGNQMDQTFFNCTNFNKPITISNNVINTHYMMYNCYNFNSPVTWLSRSLSACNFMFSNCYIFNQPININLCNTNFSALYMLSGCHNFNSPINIKCTIDGESDFFKPTTGVIGFDFGSMLNECNNFNGSIDINIDIPYVNREKSPDAKFKINLNALSGTTPFPKTEGSINLFIRVPDDINSTLRLDYFMCHKTNYNQPLNLNIIGNFSDINMCSFMYNCPDFNQPITIPNGTINADQMFAYCNSFNQPVIIPNSVKSCERMFSYCKNFNQPVTISNEVERCSQMFSYCYSFNQPITIPALAKNCYAMYMNCNNLNQRVVIPDNALSISSAFMYCTNLDNEIILGNNLIDGYMAFAYSGLTNVNIVFPESIVQYSYMFQGCDNICGNFYIKNPRGNFLSFLKPYDTLPFKQKMKNIYCNDLTLLKNSNICSTSMTWTTVTNGYYCSTFNVYLYNNMPAGI